MFAIGGLPVWLPFVLTGEVLSDMCHHTGLGCLEANRAVQLLFVPPVLGIHVSHIIANKARVNRNPLKSECNGTSDPED